MSNSNFAAGFLGSFGDTILAQQKQKQDQEENQRKSALEAATLLIQSGRVRDFTSIAPLFEVAFQPSGKGGKKGQQDIQGMLQKMLSPVLNGSQAPSQQAPAQGQPSAAPATPAGGPPAFAPGVVQPVQGSQDLKPPSPAPSATPAGGTGMFLTSDELIAQDAKAKGEGEYATTTQQIQARNDMARRMVQTHAAPDLTTAYDIIDKKDAPPKWDTFNSDGPDGTPVRYLRDRNGTVVGSQPVYEKTSTTGVEAFTGTDRQIADAMLGSRGIDPKTGKPVTDPDQRARLIEVSTEMLKQQRAAATQKQQVVNIRSEAAAQGQQTDESVAQDVVAGRQILATSGFGTAEKFRIERMANDIQDKLGLPRLNWVKIGLQQAAAQRAVTSLNSPQLQTMAISSDSVVSTIARVKDLADQLQQGSIQKWNQAKRDTIQQIYGNTPQSGLAAEYVTDIAGLQDELAQVIMRGGVPSERALDLAAKMINSNYGAQDMLKNLDEVQRLLSFRAKAANDRLNRALSGQAPQMNEGPASAGTPAPTAGGDQSFIDNVLRAAGK